MARTPRNRFRHEIEPIKGSRFIATVAPVTSDSAARAVVDEVSAEWPDASHHCSAWRLATPAAERANDDGEPSGSAGRPILASIAGRDLVDVVVVVTRWFGGTKLGVGGLVRAYGGAAAAALDLIETDEWVAMTTVDFEHRHGDIAAVDRVLAELDVNDVDTEWQTTIRRHVTLPAADLDSLRQALADATRGRVVIAPETGS